MFNSLQQKKKKGICTVINPSSEDKFAIKFCFSHKTFCGPNLKDSAPNNNSFLWCSGIMCVMKKALLAQYSHR